MSEREKHELEVVNIRLVKEPSLYSEKSLDTPKAVIELMAEELAQYDREVMCVLNLKENGQVINMNIVSMGTINSSVVAMREVFKSSILSNASHIIAIHNHPSGETTPSRDDVMATRRMQQCGVLMDIPLRDHIIVGGTTGKVLSMAQKGLLEDEEYLRAAERTMGCGKEKPKCR